MARGLDRCSHARRCSEEPIARASSDGIERAEAVAAARRAGEQLRDLTFAERGEILSRASAVLHAHRDELIQLSLENTGTTRRDGKFDVDGASGTLAYYGTLGKELGAATRITKNRWASRRHREPEASAPSRGRIRY